MYDNRTLALQDMCITEQKLGLNTHLSSNLTLASLLALRFRAGSLNTSLLTTVLSRGMSTEYLGQEMRL